MSTYDHHLRLVDLEVAMTSLVWALGQAGHSDVVNDATRKARVDGVRGAEELLQGDRTKAGYRRR